MNFGSLSAMINEWIENSILLSIKVLKGRGCSTVFHGRIINYLPDAESILLYDDDAKKVENIALLQVEDICPAESSYRLQKA